MKHLLFDFDGVIVSSWDACYDATVETYGAVPHDEFRRMFEGNVYDSDYLKDKPTETTQALDGGFFKSYIPKLMATHPYPGMPELLKEFSENMRLVVVTSSVTSPTEEYLRTYDLYQYFADVYGSDVHVSKHEKVKMVFDEFDTSAEDCLFITDTLGDMREASMANAPSIGVTWGFHETPTLLKGNPIGVADTVEELTAMIKQWAKE